MGVLRGFEFCFLVFIFLVVLAFLSSLCSIRHYLLKLPSNYFFKYFVCSILFLFSSGIPIVCLLDYLELFHGSWILCSVFFIDIYVSRCVLVLIILVGLASDSLLLSSAVSGQLMSQSKIFFISVTVFFHLTRSYRFDISVEISHLSKHVVHLFHWGL